MKHLAMAAVSALLVLSACGGDDSAEESDATDRPVEEPEAPADEPSTTQQDGEPAGESDPDEETDGTVAEDGDDGGVESLPVTGDGSCRVTVTGDLQAEWTGGGTAGDVAASYWFTDDDREILGDDFILLLNCVGDAGSLSLISGPNADETSVPFGPGSYTLTSSGASAGDDLIGALVVLNDSETNWAVMDPGGSLEITRFDDDGIAGTFEFPMEDSLASLSGEESEGTVVVSGEFDFVNPRG